MSLPPPLDAPALNPAQLDAARARLSALARRRLRADVRPAAVLVPVGHVDGELAFLFTKRADTLRSHRGQVSFPGGKRDPGDVDLVHTALRETHEEIGLGAQGIDVLGLFHDVPAISGAPVTPVVGHVGALDDLTRFSPNPGEIDTMFALRASALLDPQRRSEVELGSRRDTLPVFEAGPYPIWGLTAYVLGGVLSEVFGLSLLPPALPRRSRDSLLVE